MRTTSARSGEWTLGWRTPSRSGRWPKQSLTVFQPLIPPDWKLTLRGGEMYAQVAFSAASDQGFEAGARGAESGQRVDAG